MEQPLISRLRSLSPIQLRFVSGILFLLSGTAAYLSRIEEQILTAVPEEIMLSRIAFVPTTTETVVRYIWEMAAAAGMLFITALIILLYSLKKNKT